MTMDTMLPCVGFAEWFLASNCDHAHIVAQTYLQASHTFQKRGGDKKDDNQQVQYN